MDALEQLVTLGFDVKLANVKAVRDSQDVKLVQVSINGDLAGEGLTYATALQAAYASLRRRIEKRNAQDSALLALLPTA